MSQKFISSLLQWLGFFVFYCFFSTQLVYANEIPADSSQYTSEIKLNGVAIEGKHSIVQNKDGSIFFPAKELWIGAYLSPEWDKQNKVITFSQVGTKLTIDINKKTLQINGRLRQLEPSDVIVYKDHILVSDRLMALIFKMEINFDAGQQVLNITTRKPTPRDFLLAEIRRSKANARANKDIEETIINANGEYLLWSTTQADAAYVWQETASSKNAKKTANTEKTEEKPLLVQAPVVEPEPPPPVKKTEPVATKTFSTTKPGETPPPQYGKATELATKPIVPTTPLTKVETNTEVQQKIDKKPGPSELASAITKAIAEKTPADPKVITPTTGNVNDKKTDPKKEEKKPEPKKPEPVDANYVAAIKYNGTTIDDFHEVYQKKSGRVFYPADVVLQTAEATIEGNSQRLVLTAENLQMKLIIDSEAKTLTINNETRQLTEDDAFVTNETVLVSDELMSKVFQFDTKFSPATQELYIRSRRPMPRDLRLAREKRWDRLDAPGELTTPLIVQDDNYVLFGNPQTDVSLTWDRNPEGKQSASYNVNVVSELAGLTQQLLLSGGLDNALNAATWRAGRTSGRGQVFGIEKLYDVAIGDVSGLRTPLVGDAGSGRGIRYQYAPLGRATNFDKTVIEGNAQPGWDAELYFAGNLVDFQKVSKEGRYIFKNVPLNYGDNNIRVVLYGPQGQTQEQVYREQIGGNMVPVGEIYSSGYILQSDKPVFDLSARNAAAKAASNNTKASPTTSTDANDPFSLNTNSSSSTDPTKESFLIMGSRVDYGLSNRLTVGLFAAKSIFTPQNAVALDENLNPITVTSELDTYYGLELRPSLGQYALETGLTGRSGGGQAAYLRFALPVLGTTLSVTHDHYGLKYLSKDNGNGSLASRSTLGIAIPLGAPGSELGAINLGLDLGMQRNETNLLKSSIGYGHRIGTVFLNHQIDVQTKDTPDADLSHSGMYRLKATYRQDFWDVRAELRADLFGQGLQSISVAGQYRPDEFNSVNANLTLSPNGAYSISAGVSKNLGYGNVAFNVGYGDKKWSVAAAVSFSLGYTGSRGLNITSRQRSTMGMADIHIYEDVNADGMFNEGVDKPIPEAGITLNQQAVEGKATDKNGMLGLDELPVFGPSVVAVGLGQVSDGFLVPMYPRIQMWPRPGNAITVNYPLTEAGEISGYLRMQTPPITAVGPKAELATMSDKDNKKGKAEVDNKTKDVVKQNPVSTEQTKTTSTDTNKTAVDAKIAVPPSAVKTGTAQTTAVELSNRAADPKSSGASFVGGKTIMVNGVRERTLSTMRLQVYRPDGKLHGEVRSLSDGYFIFDNVYPGKWTLKVAPNQIYYGTPLEPVEQVVELTADSRTKNDILIFYKSDGSYDATRSAQKTPEKPIEKDKGKETENSKAAVENKSKDGNNDNKQAPEKKSE